MMRYQRVSPDIVPLSNGRKPSGENGKSITSGLNSASTFDTKGFRFRSPSRNQSPPHTENNHNQKQETGSSPSSSRGGDVLLQWGQKKRARVSRSEMRSPADESSSSGQSRHSKLPRRVESSNNNKLSSPSMPPPPPQPPHGGSFRREKDASFLPQRNIEKRSITVNGSPSRNSGSNSRVVSRSAARKRSPPTPDKVDNRKMVASSTRFSSKEERLNGSASAQLDHLNHPVSASAATPSQLEHDARVSNAASAVEKVHEVVEWPRIHIALTRKEKEDDFYAMKGTKLPQRPKKRAKNVDRALQYIFPGMWLSDLSKSRYEVREKKNLKKQKRRGLKGMESDSE